MYGTSNGFSGRARPGASSFIDVATEYSLSRKLVLAIDVTHHHAWDTRVTGSAPADQAAAGPVSVRFQSGTSDAVGLAPAVEYSWSGNAGVLLGTRIIVAGRNTAASVTPAVAVNLVY